MNALGSAYKSPLMLSRPAMHYYRAIAASVRGFVQSTSAEEAARSMYPDDGVTPIVLRAASTQATLTDVNWAAPLAQSVVSQAVQDLVAISAIGKLISLGALQVDLGRYASVVVPGGIASAADAGTWLAEGEPFTVRKLSVLGPALRPHKLGVLVLLTREMVDASNIEEIVRRLLSEAARLAVDAAIFSIAAGDAKRSPGILNGLTPVAPSGGGSTSAFEKSAQDLGDLVADIATRGGGANAAFVGSPKQIITLGFWAGGGKQDEAPVAASAALPKGTVIAIEPSSLAITIGLPEFTVSTVAAVHADDTAPNVNLIAGTPVKSMFQTDTIAVKMTLWVDWCMRAPHVSYMTGVTW